MENCKKRHFYPMLILGTALLTGSLCLLSRLAIPVFSGAMKEYQAVVSLGNLRYDEKLLEQVKKIQGLVSFSPVLEIPVELKLEDYMANTVLLSVDLEELNMKGNSSENIYIGNTPMLLVGKNALKLLRDPYGHTISKGKLAAFWEKSDRRLQYHLSEDKMGNMENSSQKNTEKTGNIEPDWMECRVMVCLCDPADGIYISLEQGKNLSRRTQEGCTKALLTVRGKEEFKKAQAVFAELSK